MTHLNTEPETGETSSVPKIDTGTIARTTTLIISLVLAALAGVNQYLSAHGRSPLTVDETTITSVVTYLVTVGTALWAWWKPNNFTERARQKYKLAEVIQRICSSTKHARNILNPSRLNPRQRTSRILSL